MQPIDDQIVLFFQSIRSEALTAFFSIFIKLEFWEVLAAVLIVYFFVRTRIFRVPVISYVVAWEMARWSYSILKDHFHRPRPFVTVKGLLPAIAPPHGFSFPSGHATVAAAIAVVLSHHFPKARPVIYFLALLVGISRVYFGVHYLSDVLGGFVLGTMVGYLSIFLESLVPAVTKGVEVKKGSFDQQHLDTRSNQ